MTTAAALADRATAFANLDATDWSAETTAIVDAILAVARTRETFSANDARASLPADVNPHRIGRAFQLLASRDVIAHAGFIRSTDRGTRGAYVAVWRLVGGAA